ncbi:MAG: DUF2283 domain-containing protein [Dehalococcoidia bacterium]
MDEPVKVWYDPEAAYLEVTLHDRARVYRDTALDQVMAEVDADGQIIDFSILKVSTLKGAPLDLSLAGAE